MSAVGSQPDCPGCGGRGLIIESYWKRFYLRPQIIRDKRANSVTTELQAMKVHWDDEEFPPPQRPCPQPSSSSVQSQGPADAGEVTAHPPETQRQSRHPSSNGWLSWTNPSLPWRDGKQEIPCEGHLKNCSMIGLKSYTTDEVYRSCTGWKEQRLSECLSEHLCHSPHASCCLGSSCWKENI